jgi:hypothetical protein
MSDLADDFRALISEWEQLAREARERARIDRVGDVQNAYYYRGAAEAYTRAVQSARALLDGGALPEAEQAAPNYAHLSEDEVSSLLNNAGLFARSLLVHDDGAFTAVFSRLQPVTQDKRLQLLNAADPRLTILDYGNLPDSGEPYVDFAFSVKS